jgi:hypothetical protein
MFSLIQLLEVLEMHLSLNMRKSKYSFYSLLNTNTSQLWFKFTDITAHALFIKTHLPVIS